MTADRAAIRARLEATHQSVPYEVTDRRQIASQAWSDLYQHAPADDGRETRTTRLREQLDLHVKALLDLPPQSAAKYHAYGVIEGLRYALDLEEEAARAS